MRLRQVLFPKRSTDIIIDYCLQHREKTYMPTTRFNKPCLTIIIIMMMMMMIMIINKNKKSDAFRKKLQKSPPYTHNASLFFISTYLLIYFLKTLSEIKRN